MKRLHLVAFASLAALTTPHSAWSSEGASLATVTVQGSAQAANEASLDAVVEAVRQTTLASQVAGAIVVLNVKVGDHVKAGQELVRIDARAAQQGVAVSASQVEAAKAQLKVASRELERQKHLHKQEYISEAALDRAQAQWEAAQAQLNALKSQTEAAQTQSGFFVIKAPYSGIVSEVPVTLGDMAMPGRPLVALYDPSALRVSAAVPQAMLGALAGKLEAVRYEVPGAPAPKPTKVELLPTIDPATHTARIRLNLPAGQAGLTPGMFARVWLPAAGDAKAAERLYVPAATVLRRAEMTGVYVVDPQGKVLLRQIRLGRAAGDRIEVLTGLRAGDKVAANPQAAAALAR
ncbi:MAG: efflux transporter, family, subunit [Rhodocyclaceae bacterium]|nr:efflux transporter, family, subunit [Rhodocyclaceae bacterium]